MDDLNDQSEKPEEPAAPVTSESVDVEAAKPPAQWKMPEPVFRQSSGFLPQGFEKRYPAAAKPATDAAGTPGAATPASAPAAPVPDAADIQPQPELEDTIEPAAPSANPAKAKDPVTGMIFGVVGLFVMAVLAIAFLGVVYCLFLSDSGCRDVFYFIRPSESQNLN
jgi:hypothetical protein